MDMDLVKTGVTGEEVVEDLAMGMVARFQDWDQPDVTWEAYNNCGRWHLVRNGADQVNTSNRSWFITYLDQVAEELGGWDIYLPKTE